VLRYHVCVFGTLLSERQGKVMYNDLALKHVAAPQNMGPLEEPDGIGEITSPYCHDTLRIYIRVRDGLIDDAGFEISGCGASIASASYGTSLIVGKSLAEASRLSCRTLARRLRLPISREHCAVLVQDAIRAAIEDYRKRLRD